MMPRRSVLTIAFAIVLASCSSRKPTQAAPRDGSATDSGSSCPPGMVLIDGGTFAMGLPPGVDGGSDEYAVSENWRPTERRVSLSPYCIDRTEVTVSSYAACTSCEPAVTFEDSSRAELTSRDRERFTELCNSNHPGRTAHPVNCVSFAQAVAYCRAVGKSLPTEAQWEYAARGADGRLYPWGNDEPSSSRLNACDSECRALKERLEFDVPETLFDDSDGYAATAPVGAFPGGASPFGVLDMAGNVEEWVADSYGLYEAGSFLDPVAPSVRRDPDPRGKVVRGGSWGSLGPSTKK